MIQGDRHFVVGGKFELVTLYAHGLDGAIMASGKESGFGITADHVRRINSGRMFADDLLIKEILDKIKDSLDQDGVLKIVACNAGKGPEGEELERQLSIFFDQKIELPEKEIRKLLFGGYELKN